MSKCDKTIIAGLNKQPGTIGPGFKRVVIKPRPNYQERVEALGLTYHDEPALEFSQCEEQAYWNEEGAIALSAKAE